MTIHNKKAITLSFSEQQFIGFLYGEERAKKLMTVKNKEEFDYYRKVYNNWKNGKRYTWNWAACLGNNLWMLYRGLFLCLFLQEAILISLPKNISALFSIVIPLFLGFFGNSFLKYLLEYQLRKKSFKNVQQAQFSSLATGLVIAVIALIPCSFFLNTLMTQRYIEIIKTLSLIIPLFLHLYYYHIKQDKKRI